MTIKKSAIDALKFKILLILLAVRFTTFWHRHRIMTHFWPAAVLTDRRGPTRTPAGQRCARKGPPTSAKTFGQSAHVASRNTGVGRPTYKT